VAAEFHESLGAPLLISGIAHVDSAIHSPNEHLALEQYHRGVEALIRFMFRMSE
jgi:acetylornithine deacetylase/succinyl-diaminopimelate desuccinylase-like protein